MLVGVAVGGFFAAGDLAAERERDRSLDDGEVVSGEVDDDYSGGDEVPVRYEHPLTGATRATAVLIDAPRPDAGERVELEVSRDDPRLVVLAGDRGVARNWVWWVAPAAVALLAAAFRWIGIMRVRRMAADPGRAFAVFGIVGPAGRWRQGAVVDVYPLDAAVGALPLCTVPVLTLGGAELDGLARRMEIKGRPRPFAWVVPSCNGDMLWPSGRARAATAERSFPGSDQVPQAYPTIDLEPVRPRRGATLWWLAGTAVALVALAVVVGVTQQGEADAERLEREGEPVVAEVLARESDNMLEVTYDAPEDDGQQTALAPVDSARDWDVGDRFPAVVDPDDPSHVRLLASPYDAAEPVVWATFPLLVALVGLWSSASRDRTVRRLASGPWRAVEARHGRAGSSSASASWCPLRELLGPAPALRPVRRDRPRRRRACPRPNVGSPSRRHRRRRPRLARCTRPDRPHGSCRCAAIRAGETASSFTHSVAARSRHDRPPETPPHPNLKPLRSLADSHRLARTIRQRTRRN